MFFFPTVSSLPHCDSNKTKKSNHICVSLLVSTALSHHSPNLARCKVKHSQKLHHRKLSPSSSESQHARLGRHRHNRCINETKTRRQCFECKQKWEKKCLTNFSVLIEKIEIETENFPNSLFFCVLPPKNFLFLARCWWKSSAAGR